jgi:hypothetical protein
VQVEGETSLYEVDAGLMEDVSLDYLFYRDREVLDLADGDVRMLKVMRDGVAQSVEKNDEGAFVTPDDGAGEVDQDAVLDILGVVRTLRALRYVAEDPEDLAAFGLAEPVCLVTLGLTGESGIEKTLLLGSAAKGGGRYAMIRGEDVVFITEEVLLDLLRRELYAPAPAPATAE